MSDPSDAMDKLSVEDEEDDDDLPEDIGADLPVASEADLIADINESKEILKLFLNNKHEEAAKRVTARAEKSIYSALALGTLHFLKAFVTFDPTDIAAAVATLKRSTALCNRRRKKVSLKSKMGKKNYNSYTEEEVHAELCYAECLLIRGVITFIQDENMMNIVKGGLRFRKSFRVYKECTDILESRNWPNETLRKNFECGVLMGSGGFNLIISILPKRILKLVEFVGFSGKRDVGNKKLDEGQKMQDCLRGPLCSLFVLTYNGFLTYLFGRGCTDLAYLESVLKPWFAAFPESGVVALSKGRLENIKGNIREAIPLLEGALKIPLDWKNFYHLTYFELGWNHILLGDYRKTVPFADILYKENHWSKVTTTYSKAILLYSCNDITNSEKNEVNELLKTVPSLKKRYSGKSNPLEKFFIRKSDRYFAQNNWLLLPLYEMMYVSNYIMLVSGKMDILQPMLEKIEAALVEVKGKTDSKYYADNYCLAVLLKGLILKYMKKIPAAEECFKEVLQNHKKIKEDIYLPVCANLELGLICMENKNYSQADQYLKTAKKEKTFWPEFRIHQAREEIKAMKHK